MRKQNRNPLPTCRVREATTGERRRSFLSKHGIDTEGYTIDESGIIRDPGKFEVEHVSALYYWDAFMNGDSGEHEDSDGTMWFEATAEEIIAFEFEHRYVTLRVDDCGFVYCRNNEDTLPDY